MSNERPKQKKATFADFKNVELIGQGAFGTVYKGIYDKNNKAFAIKKISKKKIISQNMTSQVRKQIQIMRELNHPNIVKLYDLLQDEEHLYLVLELAEKGQLYTKLMQKGRFDQTSTKAIVVDLVQALSYLHHRNPPIIHRDIKPQNILLDKNDRVKLADFGWSNFSNKQRTTYCGTYDYLAPEMIEKTGHDEKLDIWCLGVLVYQMLVGKAPFAPLQGEEDKRLQQNILNVRINFPSDFPVLAKEFVMKILKRNPKDRATLQQLKNHQWLQMKPISKLPAAHIQQPILAMPESPNNATSPNDQHYRRIIEELNKKNQELDRQVNTLKINEQLRTQKDQQKDIGAGGDDRKYKLLEEMNEKYKKEITRLQGELEEKAREIGRLRSETRGIDQCKKNADRYKQERNQLQESYKSLQQIHQDMEKKYIDLTQRYENDKLDYELKLKQLRYQSNGHIAIDSPEGMSKLQQAISELTRKFIESKKILSDIAKRQSAVSEAEKQLQKISFEQNSIRDEIRMELKQQYEQQMDEILLKAREQLMTQRQKWMQQREHLTNLERQSTMDTENSALNSTRDLELQNQLKLVRQHNIFLEKRVKEQEYKIRDLQDMRKKR